MMKKNHKMVPKLKKYKNSHMDNCTLDCILIKGNFDYGEMCSFTKDFCVQDTVQFIQSYYCGLHGSFMILFFLGIPLFYLLMKAIDVVAQDYLSPSVQQFISEFKISPTLAGVTFLAFANGAPDVMTAIIAGSSNSNSTNLIPFGSIFGACLFSTAFIFSTIIFNMPNKILTVKIRQVILPLSIYIIAILFIIAVTVFYGKMNILLASFLLVLYLIYIILVIKTERDVKKKQSLIMSTDIEQTIAQHSKQKNQKQEQKQEQQLQQVGLFKRLGKKTEQILIIVLQRLIPPFNMKKWNPINAVISIIVSPFILAATQQIPKIFKQFIGPIPVFLLMSIPAIFLLAYTVYCIVRKQQPYYIKPFTIYSFLISIAALTVVCSILINFMELIQLLTSVNPVFLGLTVFAWANSIGDYFTIVHFAKSGNSSTSVAGIYSGQLFNFLLGFGVSLVIQSYDGEYQYKIFDFVGDTYDKISDSIVMLVIFGGLFYLIYILVMTKIKNGEFQIGQAKFSMWYYIGFVLVSCFLSLLTDFYNQIECNIDENL